MNLNTPAIKRLGEVLVFAALSVALMQQIFDWDVWYHLSIGREIAATHGIPGMEFLVYPSAGQPGEYHEWGFGLLFFSIYELAGFWGICILNAVIASLTLWFLFRAVDKNPWSSPANLLVLLAVFLWVHFRFTYRPEMILYLALACEIYLLERFCVSREWKWLTLVPVLGLILSQAHPSVIFLLIILATYALQIAWESRKQKNNVFKYMTWFFLCGVSTVAFSLLNPYGLDQLLLPLSFAQQEKVTMNIQEFAPSLDSVLKWQYISLIAVSLAALIVQHKKRVLDWLLFLLFGYLAYRYVRNIALFALVMFVPMARGGADLYQLGAGFFERRHSSFGSRHYQIILWGMTVAILTYISISEVSHHWWGAGPQPGQYPEKSVLAIKELQPPGQIFNNYEMGGYLGWALEGQYQVFIDGRNYNMTRALAAYRSIGQTRAGWKKALDHYDVNAIIFPPKLLAGKLLPLLNELADDHAWTLAVAENRELLFLRNEALTDLPAHYRLEKQQMWPLIANEARRMMISFPDEHMAHVTLAAAFLRLGDRQRAIAAYRDYLALEPGDKEIASRLAELESGQ